MTLQLYNADCLEQMKTIPDKSIDLIICDLPYGCLTTGESKNILKRADNPDKDNNREGVIAGCAWDIKLDLDLFWKQVKRIRKDDHTPCIHFCSTRFGIDLINSNPKEFRYDIVWCKSNAVGFLSANKKPMSGHEMIYVFSKKGANYNRIDIAGEPYPVKKDKISETKKIHNHSGITRTHTENTGTRCVKSWIQFETIKTKSKHPTAKPLDLYKWLIERYSNEGATVLDPTFGSCNSGRVCRELKRNYIGIEMNKQFYDNAQSLLEPTPVSTDG
jgi:site-specific DNA-methyltransferase (adenine-specific)